MCFLGVGYIFYGLSIDPSKYMEEISKFIPGTFVSNVYSKVCQPLDICSLHYKCCVTKLKHYISTCCSMPERVKAT